MVLLQLEGHCRLRWVGSLLHQLGQNARGGLFRKLGIDHTTGHHFRTSELYSYNHLVIYLVVVQVPHGLSFLDGA